MYLHNYKQVDTMVSIQDLISMQLKMCLLSFVQA